MRRRSLALLATAAAAVLMFAGAATGAVLSMSLNSGDTGHVTCYGTNGAGGTLTRTVISPSNWTIQCR